MTPIASGRRFPGTDKEPYPSSELKVSKTPVNVERMEYLGPTGALQRPFFSAISIIAENDCTRKRKAPRRD
jgi:hypothetical protein